MPKPSSKQPAALSAAFWDTSAIIPLCYHQIQTQKAQQAYRFFPEMVVWWSTPVESASALYRLKREGELTAQQVQQSFAALEKYSRRWTEITPADEVRVLAQQLLKKHQLRAADSLQLAAAMIWCNSLPKGRTVISDDGKLLIAAENEGFNTLKV